MRAGGEYFLEPAEAVQRRYEALRCYFVGGRQRRERRCPLQLLTVTHPRPFTSSPPSYAPVGAASSVPPSPVRRGHARPTPSGTGCWCCAPQTVPRRHRGPARRPPPTCAAERAAGGSFCRTTFR